MTLSEMRNVDIRTVDRKNLVQRDTVKIDSGKEKEERIIEYMGKIGNPYCYLEGDTVVKISFVETARTLEDCLCGYLGGI